MSGNHPSFTPEHQALLQRFDELTSLIPEREAEKEHLLNHSVPMLNAQYLNVVGEAKLELLGLQLEAYIIRRKVEMARAALQRGSPILIEVIETLVAAEAKERKEKIEAEARRLQDALRFVAIEPLSSEDAELLKKTYYALAKALHPDLNPDASEHEHLLWLQVQEAHAAGDLQRLLYLRDVVESRQTSNAMEIRSSMERLKERCTRLEATLQRIENQISTIKSAFPYTHAEQIYDEIWIAEQNANIGSAKAAIMQEIAAYQELLRTLLEGGEHE